MTTHRCWKTTLRLSVVVFFLLGLAWFVMQARQWLFTEAYDSLG